MSRNATSTVITSVKSAIERYLMLENCDTVVVGFSGGADSVCLLTALNSLKTGLSFELIAAHVNHGIRGDEAERDAMFCEEYCKKIGVEFHLFNVDCPLEAKKSGESLEECARRLRYECLNSLANERKVRIATAHNANDNSETVLFNIARGASLRGACGIPPTRDNIIRPLLFCTRTEIEAFCAENQIDFVTDSTNLCDDYSRNRLRHSVLPTLESVNSAAVTNFSRFTESARADCDYLDEMASEEYNKLFCCGKCSAKALSSLHTSLKRRVLALALKASCDGRCDLEHLTLLEELLENGGRCQLFGDFFAENVGGSFRIFRNQKSAVLDEKIVTLPYFTVKFGEYIIQGEKYTQSSKKVSKFVLDNCIDCGKISGNAYFRCRKEGDSFTLPHRKVTKSLKKLFNELNIPVEKRESLPVLCDDNGIVWIYSIGVNSEYLPNENSVDICLIKE